MTTDESRAAPRLTLNTRMRITTDQQRGANNIIHTTRTHARLRSSGWSYHNTRTFTMLIVQQGHEGRIHLATLSL